MNDPQSDEERQFEQFQQYQQAYAAAMPEPVNLFTALRKYADFGGRAGRKEYWLFFLLQLIISIAFSIAGEATDKSVTLALIQGLVNLALFIPGLAVFFRRLHDTGHSAWNMLWYLLPLIGWIVLLVYLLKDSQPGPNQYGWNPKGIGNESC